jgi:hypothetical protein
MINDRSLLVPDICTVRSIRYFGLKPAVSRERHEGLVWAVRYQHLSVTTQPNASPIMFHIGMDILFQITPPPCI